MDYIGMGRRIKSARRELNLTQEELSSAIGISLSFLGHIERGSRKASLETLIKLANKLGKSLDLLLSDSLTIKEEVALEPPILVLQSLQSPPMRASKKKQPKRDDEDSKAEEQEMLSSLSSYLGFTAEDSEDGGEDGEWDC